MSELKSFSEVGSKTSENAFNSEKKALYEDSIRPLGIELPQSRSEKMNDIPAYSDSERISSENVLPENSNFLVGETKDKSEIETDKVSDIQQKQDTSLAKDIAIKNKLDGIQREHDAFDELEKQYPSEDGYSILSESYLRDKDGNILKDPVSGEARRIDFVVVKDNAAVDSIEVTSKTADKTNQMAKEERIRENGGNYIRDDNGNMVELPLNVNTRIERRG